MREQEQLQDADEGKKKKKKKKEKEKKKKKRKKKKKKNLSPSCKTQRVSLRGLPHQIFCFHFNCWPGLVDETIHRD